MASQTFTPSTRVTADSNPRDWAYELGLLPQNASIVFTKSSLIAYLKTHEIEVGPNYAEINKVPRFASVGTMSAAGPPAEASSTGAAKPVAASVASTLGSEPSVEPVKPTPETQMDAVEAAPAPAPAAVAAPESAPALAKPSSTASPPQSTQPAFRPSRRVREPIGGGSAQISALFGGDESDASHEESLREASYENARRRGLLQEHNAAPQEITSKPMAPEAPRDVENDAPVAANTYRPSRRVREPGGTGGSSSITLG